MTINVKVWLEACRLRTLPLSLSCILMGTFLAADKGYFRLEIFLLAVSTTVLLQILSNLANDYGDSIHGADNVDRQGPSRTVQKGSISKNEMKKAMFLFSGLSFLSGVSLLYITFQDQLVYLLIFLGIGVMSILAAINYTAGSKPYGYRGLGDLAVLIFFGFVGVGGTYFLQTRSIDLVSLLPALSCGLFATGVLNINNIRDIESDKIAGKISIPVRLGREKAVMYHWIIITTGFLSSVVFVLLNFTNISEWIFLITLPFFFINAKAVYTNHEPKSIDPYLKQLSLTTLAFVITFGAGLLIANWIS